MKLLLILLTLGGCVPHGPSPLPCETVGPHRCTVVDHVDGER
jgi:hypothetical protein